MQFHEVDGTFRERKRTPHIGSTAGDAGGKIGRERIKVKMWMYRMGTSDAFIVHEMRNE